MSLSACTPGSGVDSRYDAIAVGVLAIVAKPEQKCARPAMVPVKYGNSGDGSAGLHNRLMPRTTSVAVTCRPPGTSQRAPPRRSIVYVRPSSLILGSRLARSGTGRTGEAADGDGDGDGDGDPDGDADPEALAPPDAVAEAPVAAEVAPDIGVVAVDGDDCAPAPPLAVAGNCDV